MFKDVSLQVLEEFVECGYFVEVANKIKGLQFTVHNDRTSTNELARRRYRDDPHEAKRKKSNFRAWYERLKASPDFRDWAISKSRSRNAKLREIDRQLREKRKAASNGSSSKGNKEEG